MKIQELHKGMKVVTNTMPDATVYTVETIKNFTVELTYFLPNGSKVSGGVLDACYLKFPTSEQLENA
jgi:hypothetical protein